MALTTQTDGALNNLTPKAATYQHPVYVTYLPIWRKLAHVREGAGGFLDGTYLIAHPREWVDHTATVPVTPTKKLKARRTLACYENFAATIIEAKKSALFREQPTRRVGDDAEKDREPAPLEEWWQDVDGCGTHMDDFVWLAWDAAATFGHVYIYMDREAPEAEEGYEPTAADAARPYLRIYTPLDVPDWLEDDRGELQAVKFLEPVPRTSLDVSTQHADYQVRIVDREKWTVYDKKGKASKSGPHGMGALPVVRLYAQRRPLTPGVGQSILHDPQLFIDLYNLLSELRELLRNQTFSILNVPLGTGPDAMTVQTAKELLGASTGTEDVLFSGAAAGFISADAANVASYQTEIDRRLRHIYRLAAIQWESDSKDAEAEGSMELKREDMNQRLSAYADELEKAEYAVNRLWYRAMYGGDDGIVKYEADEVIVNYPNNFDVTPFKVVLEQAQAAMSLGMPSEFLKEMRKRLVTKFLPDLAPSAVEKMEAAIDAEPDDPTPAEQTRQRMELSMQAVKQGGKPPKDEKAA